MSAKRTTCLILVLAAAALAAGRATAREVEPACHWEEYALDSGRHDGAGGEVRLAFSAVVEHTDAVWLQLDFGDCELGAASFLAVTSLRDGAREPLDTTGLAHRRNRSAAFNGDGVRVELFVAPGDLDVEFSVERVLVGEVSEGPSGGPRTLCYGDDQRQTWFDDAVGRKVNATGTVYISASDALITAGHCANPLVEFDIVEFHVPASNPDGGINHPSPADQYTVDHASVYFSDEGDEIGNDWAVFRCFPNPSTGLLPVEAQGAYKRLTKDLAPENVRVTGYGVDETPPGSSGGENADSRTLQSDGGYYLGETVESPADVYFEHTADTEGGSSGSPVCMLGTNVSLGIHEGGGCDPPDVGNVGTSFENDLVETVLENYFPGGVFVDAEHPSPLQEGTILRPCHTVALGAALVPATGDLMIVEGEYDEAITIATPMTITAPLGPVVIGQ